MNPQQPTPIPTVDLDRALAAVDLAKQGRASPVPIQSDPRKLLRDLAQRGALENALVMIETDDPACVSVRPRTGAGLLTITEILEDDHRRLDALANRVIHAVEKREPVELRTLRAFVWGLRRHIRIEEELLFPRFELETGTQNGGPTFVMRVEHRSIEALLATLEAHAPASDTVATAVQTEQLDGAFGQLASVLEEHNAKEENILYPTTDRVIVPADRAALIVAMMTM